MTIPILVRLIIICYVYFIVIRKAFLFYAITNSKMILVPMQDARQYCLIGKLLKGNLHPRSMHS